MKKQICAVLLSLAVLFLPVLTEATQLNSTVATTALSLTVNESISVSATPGTITFTYGSGAATASGPISVTTTWSAASTRTQVITLAFFSSASAALTGPSSIPTSQVFAAVNGAANAACTLTSTAIPALTASAVCPTVFQQNSPVPSSGTNTSSVVLLLSGLGTLAPGTFSGTLNIESTLI